MSFTKNTAQSVLILMTDKHLGNLIVSLPAIHALVEYFKGSRLCLVVDNSYSEIADTVRGLEKVICYPRNNFV